MSAGEWPPGAADAEAQLAALRADRAALADRVVQPWWYDVLLGLLVGGFVASYSTHDPWWILAALVVLSLGCRVLMAVYRRITGFWISGDRPGPTQRAMRVWMVAYGIVMAIGASAEYLLDVRGAMVAAGVVLGIGIAVISRWWTRIYVADLRSSL